MARPAFKNAKRNPYNFLLYTAIQRNGAEVIEYSSKKFCFHIGIYYIFIGLKAFLKQNLTYQPIGRKRSIHFYLIQPANVGRKSYGPCMI